MNLDKTDAGVTRLHESLNDDADGRVVIRKVSVGTGEKLAIEPALTSAEP